MVTNTTSQDPLFNLTVNGEDFHLFSLSKQIISEKKQRWPKWKNQVSFQSSVLIFYSAYFFMWFIWPAPSVSCADVIITVQCSL